MAAVSPRPYAECRKLFHAECVRLAELAHGRYCRNVYQQLYLCGTKRTGLDTHNPSVGIWERLSIATAEEVESRDFLTVVRPEPLPRSQTLEHLTDTVRDWLKSEPLWCFAD